MDPIHLKCFKKCKDGFTSGGTVCWKDCEKGTSPCGGAICLDDKEKDKCTETASAYISKSIDEIKVEAAGKEGDLFNAGTVLPDIKLPVCP